MDGCFNKNPKLLDLNILSVNVSFSFRRINCKLYHDINCGIPAATILLPLIGDPPEYPSSFLVFLNSREKTGF